MQKRFKKYKQVLLFSLFMGIMIIMAGFILGLAFIPNVTNERFVASPYAVLSLVGLFQSMAAFITLVIFRDFM